MHFIAPDKEIAASRLPLFEVRDLSFLYPDGKKALHDISLKIHQGDRIALVGQNGSGKTTLVKHLNGLYSPANGTVLYKGEALNDDIVKVVRLEVGIMFQDPDDHLFCNTLYEDVAFGPMNQGLGVELVDQRVKKALADAGLAELMYKPAHLLSVGQKKRAAFAAIMAMAPDVLILDEPSSNLDPKQERIFKEMLRGFPGTLICINHDLLFLYGLCDRAIVLADGEIHHDFSFDDLLSHPDSLREHGLDFTFRFSCCQNGEHDHHHHHAAFPEVAEGSSLDNSTSNPLLSLQQYSYWYADQTKALDSINFTLERGDSVALIGENGAGKSTLASVLLGLNRGKGDYYYAGSPVQNNNRKNLWRSMGIVFQDSADQLFCPTCQEEVAFGPKQLGFSGKELEERVAKALDLVSLQGYEDRVPLNMSGGERKRLAIASALSMQPEVLILDEPTAGLDPRGEEQLLDILQKLSVTMILISHDLFFVQSLCRRTIVMHQGGIIRDYLTSDFLADEHLESFNELDFTFKNSCSHEILALQGVVCE